MPPMRRGAVASPDSIRHAGPMPPVSRTRSQPAARVLIIDQDRRVRRDLAGLISLRPGLKVVGTAGDPAAAVEAVRAERPDVVLIDPRLPDVDAGFAVMAVMRARWPGTRFVVMSHVGGLEDLALARGADAFVAKSGEHMVLLDAIAGSPARRPAS